MAKEALEARIRQGISGTLTQWRLFNLSLASKCMVLFGLAVLLIIVVALSVPWYRMERLVEQRNSKEARVIADQYLMFQVHGRYVGLTDEKAETVFDLQQMRDYFSSDSARKYPKPKLIKLAGKQSAQPAPPDKFIARAIKLFRSDPSITQAFRSDRDAQKNKIYKYVRAVRVRQSCLDCHQQVVPNEQYSAGQLVAVISLTMAADPTDRQLLWNRAAIIAAVALATLFAIAVFYFITHWIILGPVDQLRRATQQVIDGDLDTRVIMQSGDEFEQFANTFNQMLAHLQESHLELSTINKSLDTKLSDLAQTNVDLYQANKLKSEFLANVSHELRTPLNSIIGFAELTAENKNLTADAKTNRYIKNILTSARSLLEIINDLLDLAKIEGGKMQLRIEKLSLVDLFENLLNFIKPLIDKKQLQMQSILDDNLPLMNSDAGKIQQILYNLLSNAIKFTPEGGRITLRAEYLPPRQVRLSVTDSGPGIPEDKHHEIFEKFLQIDGSVSRGYGGAGLGLAIAKEFAIMMGGTIAVDSQPTKGATFCVTLPVNAPEKSASEPAPTSTS